MRIAASALALLSMGAGARATQVAPACEAPLRRVMQATGTSVGLVRSTGDTVELTAPGIASLSVNCSRAVPENVFASAGTAFPANAYFALVAAAGAAVTGDEPAAVEAAARRCRDQALGEGDGEGSAPTARGKMECQTTRGVDGNVVMTVFAVE